ncbi:hypothetical protein [Streptomyces sp. NPDC048057]|uniref:hypothetical protein n=1 Tax=Streptomyces sp. NPDC048057 TaxID=3155628 RepID=UPI0033F3D9D7
MTDDGTERGLVLVSEGLSSEAVATAHRAALRVARPGIGTAHVDAYSDAPWPPEVLASYGAVLALGRAEAAARGDSRRVDVGMGVDVDVRDDAQFALLLDLAPYTIGAEGWRGDRPVFSASDTGTSLWVRLTAAGEAELCAQLAARGVSPEVFVEAVR